MRIASPGPHPLLQVYLVNPEDVLEPGLEVILLLDGGAVDAVVGKQLPVGELPVLHVVLGGQRLAVGLGAAPELPRLRVLVPGVGLGLQLPQLFGAVGYAQHSLGVGTRQVLVVVLHQLLLEGLLPAIAAGRAGVVLLDVELLQPLVQLLLLLTVGARLQHGAGHH